MSRERLITSLKSVHGVASDVELVNTLQGMGLVADEAVNLADCADSDLVRAWNRAVTHGEEAA